MKINPSTMSNQDLLDMIKMQVVIGRDALVKLLCCLLQVERRGLHLEYGFNSLYAYCRHMGFSENESWRRAAAAGIIGRCPLALDGLAQGRQHLTGLAQLQTFFRKNPKADIENIVRQCEGLSRAEIDILLAQHSVSTDRPRRPQLRPLSTAKPAGPDAEQKSSDLFAACGNSASQKFPPAGAAPSGPNIAAGSKTDESSSPSSASSPVDANSAKKSPHSPPSSVPSLKSAVGFELRVQLDSDTKADLDTIQNLLRHRLPRGNLNEVIKLVLHETARDLRKKKSCSLKPPAAPIETSSSAKRPKRNNQAPRRAKQGVAIGAVVGPNAGQYAEQYAEQNAEQNAGQNAEQNAGQIADQIADQNAEQNAGQNLGPYVGQNAEHATDHIFAEEAALVYQEGSFSETKQLSQESLGGDQGLQVPLSAGDYQKAGPRRTRSIPRAIRRTVFERDGGVCTWRGPDGRRCAARAFLEFHHLQPFALGGEHSARNIALLCRAHNQFDAVRIFGQRSC